MLKFLKILFSVILLVNSPQEGDIYLKNKQERAVWRMNGQQAHA